MILIPNEACKIGRMTALFHYTENPNLRDGLKTKIAFRFSYKIDDQPHSLLPSPPIFYYSFYQNPYRKQMIQL